MKDRRFDQFLGRFDAFLERFDAHIGKMDAHVERMDAHVERMDAHVERMDAHVERMDTFIAKIDVRMSETTAAIRESAIRQERALQAFETRLAIVEQEFQETREERRAHTQAIWALLDRWGYGPPPNPA